MGVNLSSGAISKLMTGKCTENDMKPVLQVIDICGHKKIGADNKQWYAVGLSDGSFEQYGCIPGEIFISNKLQIGSIVQLTKFRLIDPHRYILVCDLTLLRTTCNTIGDPKPLPDNVEETPTSKQKQGNVDSHLTSGAISKLITDKCTSDDMKPVLQVTFISSETHTRYNKPWYGVALSDGSYRLIGFIPDEFFISNKLQKGSIVQLTMFQVHFLYQTSDFYGYILVCDLNLLRRKCDIIGFPKPLPDNDNPLVVRTTPTITHEDHVDSHLNENIDDSRHVQEPPTSKQKQDHVNLTPGAITKIMTENFDLKPVLQLTYIRQDSRLMWYINGKQWYEVLLSDGSSEQLGFIADEMIRSKQLQLQTGSIAQLTKFQLFKDPNLMGEMRSMILVSDLTVIHSKSGIIGDPKLLPANETPLVERTAPTIPNEDQIHANSHHVEEPPISIQNPSTSTQKCSSHSPTQNNTDTIMGVNLTPGAITKIMTDKCSSTDLKPVVQVTNILSGRISTKNDKHCYKKIVLSDGSSSHFGCIADDIFISNKLQKGYVVQLTKFHFTKLSIYGNIRVLLINDLNVIHSKCDIIVNQEPFPRNDTPLVERSTPPIPDEDHADGSHAQESVTSSQKCFVTQSRERKHQSSNETPVLKRSKPFIIDHDHSESDTNEDVDNSHPAEEPSATTQKCSSHSLNQSKKRKHRSSNDNISKAVEDVSKMTKLTMEKIKTVDVGFKRLETLEEDVSKMTKMMEKNKEDDVGACFKKLETLEENVSKMTKIMEKNKEDNVGACFKKLETLEEDVSKMTRMMMEKNKEDNVGACFKKLETVEEDVSKMAKMVMEKSKEVDMGFKKLETLEEDVSKMTRMMMEKNKEVDVGYKKLETLEEDVSRMTIMMMEKNKEDVVGFKKLETLEEDVCKMTKMMEKNKEDDIGACFKKLETLEENVSKLTRMMMEKNKDDDMGACIEKLDKIGWVAQDPMYDTALLLFGQSADYRKLWLHLKPESCGNWVKNAGCMFGLLD